MQIPPSDNPSPFRPAPVPGLRPLSDVNLEKPVGGSGDAGPVKTRDPGGPMAGLVAWLMALVLMGAVIFLNQCEGPPPATAPTTITAPDIDATTIMSKVVVKMEAAGFMDPQSRQMFGQQLTESAETSVDRFRAGIAIAESREAGVLNSAEAIERLGTVKAEVEAITKGGTSAEDSAKSTGGGSAGTSSAPSPGGSRAIFTKPKSSKPAPVATPAIAEQLLKDIESARRVYSGETLSDDELKGLRERHGWFGELLATHGKDKTDPAREPLVSGGGGLLALAFGVIGLFVFAVLGSIASIIVLILRIATNPKFRPGFVAPIPGGSVFIEMLPVFVIGFLGVKFVGAAIVKATGSHPLSVLLPLQWSLVLTLFWPLLRGMPFGEFRRAIGWHSGKGVFREIGAGVVGYLAGLPLFVLGIAITFFLMIIRAAITGVSKPPHNSIADAFSSASGWQLVLLALLATVWAPIVEEAIFRGAMYRHLRGRVPVLIAAPITAVFFGLMHGYDVIMLGPVIMLGFTFALMREWRGSLIASMTAHCLHNATITLIMATALHMLR